MILITVFDGLRPDFVRPELTPTLWRLRENGVWFAESHSVYPSNTRVNAPALATGSFPATHTIPANRVFSAAVEPLALLDTGNHEHLQRLGTAQPLLGAPTLAAVLRAAGRRTVVCGTGSPGCAYLLNPDAGEPDLLFHPAFCRPTELGAEIEAVVGPSPVAGTAANDPERPLRLVEYGARALAEVLVPRAGADVAYFWCTIPDGPQHRYGLGDPRSLQLLKGADRVFGELLQRLQATTGSEPDVFVTADHGYVTVLRQIDLAASLREAGLVSRPDFKDTVIIPDGNSAHIHLLDGSEARRQRIAAFLLTQRWTAAVFSKGGAAAGTLSLVDVNHQSHRSPDLLCAFEWGTGANVFGVNGLSTGCGQIAVGAGDHGGISPFEMHNTLIASGPSFRRGWTDTAACGITDIAPTVLAILGLPRPPQWSGRELSEALRDGPPPPASEHRVVRAEYALPDGQTVSQELTLALAGVTSYVCQARKSVISAGAA